MTMRALSLSATAPVRRDWLSRKIAQLRDEGYPERQAVAIAYHEATAVYLRRRRPIPADLIRQYRDQKARVNPRRVTAKKKSKAERLYKGFRESDPKGVEKWPIPSDTRGVKMGRCVGIIYETTIGGSPEKYIHEFRRDAAPVLAVGENGAQLYLLGGKYRVTARGIVDRRK